ncbi:MAG: hypothetical protein ACREPX_07000 [Rhodanobacteraceae bacterium]
MRTPALIALAALVGFGVAWLLLTQVDQPPAPSGLAASSAPVVAPTPVPPPTPAPVSASVPTSAPVHEQPPPQPETAPAPKTVQPVTAKPAEPIATEPGPAEPAVAEEESPDEETPAEEEGGPTPIDADRAADVLADLIALQDAATDESGLPNVTGQTWKKFDQEQADPEWSEPTAQQIEQTLDQWIAGLPEEVRAHIAVIHVECRATLCQILAADNDIDTQNERAQAGQEWQQAIASLHAQAWWNELGFVDASTQVTANEGHTLYMTYLLREVKPPSP